MTSRLLSLAVLACIGGFGAEFDARSIDGVPYTASARSLESGKNYPVTVRFEGRHVSVLFKSGRKLDFIWDEETIVDPEEIVGRDQFGLWWALSVDRIAPRESRTDSPSNGIACTFLGRTVTGMKN
jgi:hypothetical protein